MRQPIVAQLIAIGVLFAGTSSAELCPAEDLPQSGVFEGFYRQDRWGVGRFSFYLVAPALHEQLKPYAGKRIMLEILNAHQYANPGDAIVTRVGKITEIAGSQVHLEMKVRVTKHAAQTELRNVEFTFFLKNESDKPVELSLQDVHFDI